MLNFVDMLKGVNHGSVLEHGTVYMLMPCTTHFSGCINFYANDKYTKVVDCKIGNEYFYAITTNYRVLFNGQDNPFTDVWQDLEELQCEPTEFHEKRVTVRFICTIGISREFNRHRVHSITEQSTRYCNYSKDKFGNEVTFIKPLWYVNRLDRKDYAGSAEENYEIALGQAEQNYFALLNCNWKPQQAREVLPLNTATELIHTAFVSDWKHFFHLRTAVSAHPQAYELANPLHEEFKKLKLV